MRALQTKNGILYNQQFCENTLKQHTLQFPALRCLKQTQSLYMKIDSHILYRIITTCGDANAMFGTKHIDPALCLYEGAIVMCIDNKNLKDKVPRGNGTICRVIKIEIKQNAPSYKCKNYYGKKVWTVNAIDVCIIFKIRKPGRIYELPTQC